MLSGDFTCRPSAFAVARKASFAAQNTRAGGQLASSYYGWWRLPFRHTITNPAAVAGLLCHKFVRPQRCQRACTPVAAIAGGPEQQIVTDLISRYLDCLLLISCGGAPHPMDASLVQANYLVCSVPTQLEHMSTQLTTSLFTLAESAAVDPAVVTDTVSAKNGGFFGPLASLFETFLKVNKRHSAFCYIWHTP